MEEELCVGNEIQAEVPGFLVSLREEWKFVNILLLLTAHRIDGCSPRIPSGADMETHTPLGSSSTLFIPSFPGKDFRRNLIIHLLIPLFTLNVTHFLKQSLFLNSYVSVWCLCLLNVHHLFTDAGITFTLVTSTISIFTFKCLTSYQSSCISLAQYSGTTLFFLLKLTFYSSFFLGLFSFG